MCSSTVLVTVLHPDPSTALLRKAWESTHSCTSLAVNFTWLLEWKMSFPNEQGKSQFGMQLANVGMSHSWTCVLNNQLQSGGDWYVREGQVPWSVSSCWRRHRLSLQRRHLYVQFSIVLISWQFMAIVKQRNSTQLNGNRVKSSSSLSSWHWLLRRQRVF